MARILLGVSGSIAAYKALDFIRRAQEAGHSLRVLQTESARRFVGEEALAALSGAPVLCAESVEDPAWGAFPGQQRPDCQPISHLQVAHNADLYLIAPASANMIAKLAHGLADNILCSAALAARCPLLIAPAMNNQMYQHPATQENLQLLTRRGVRIVAPGTGRLAGRGEHGVGRLAETAELLAACEQALGGSAAAGPWAGKRVLISAGGTREPLDSVRYIGNRSSGRMGVAIAEQALAAGAQVTVVGANLSVAVPAQAQLIAVQSAVEMQAALEAHLAAADALFMAAAVADFKPAAPAEGKIKKAQQDSLRLELTPTTDILAALSARRRAGQLFIGFAAEHGPQGVAEARRKLLDKRLDAVVLNDISRADIGFESQANEVLVLCGERQVELARAPKPQIARALLELIGELLPAPALPDGAAQPPAA